jgi:transposase
LLNYGLDVHKRYTTFCVMDDAGQILMQGRSPNQELPFHPALSLKGKKRAVMEAGGNWYALYDRLEPVMDELVLAHPLRVRAIASARVKTDEIDARTLAHLLRADLIPAAYVPPRETRDLRELLRYRQDLVKQRSALKNRVHALLAKDGYNSPYTDLFGREGRRWLDDIALREQQRYQLEGYLRVLDCLSEQIQAADARVRKTCSLSPAARSLLKVPGIGPLSALTILAELGDVTRFPTPEHVVSFAGLAPSVYSSGGKTRRGPITKQGPSALRWVLIEAAHHAVRKPGRLGRLYQRLCRGKHKSVAITACARELLVIVYKMLKRGEAYRGDGSSSYRLPPEVT